jgi:hypothetical protein
MQRLETCVVGYVPCQRLLQKSSQDDTEVDVKI